MSATLFMPSQILHTLFGEDVLGINPARCGAFALGCQGPDIFYHSRRSRPVALEYGSLLHRRDYGVFCGYLKANTDIGAPDELGAYTLGFLTHAVLDRFCHPYIIYKAGAYHSFFERIIDVLMLRELRGQEAAAWDQGLLADSCENPPPGLQELIAGALAAAFPEKAGRDGKLDRRIGNALGDSGRYYRLSDPAHTCLGAWRKAGRPDIDSRHVSLLYPENLPGGIDFLNLKREPWHYPYQPAGAAAPDCRSFIGIYADAVETARASYLDPGNGCLSIHDEAGKPCAPNLASPLPLDAVLQGQVEMRLANK